MGSLEKAFQTA